MTQPGSITSVSIRPDVGVLSVLRHLNYRPWYALAEFVDNSLESFLRHQEKIHAIEGRKATLKVEVTIDAADEGVISIRDNAAGIYGHEYQRAFRPAEPPPQVNGLSEFGMGMKSAACWFGRSFTVRSCALGEDIERTVTFDIDDIVRTKSDTLPVRTAKAEENHHYTEVVLLNLHKPPQGRTIGKIKEHLASIYRAFIKEGILELRFRSAGIDEILKYEEPEILIAPPAEALIRRRKLSSEPQLWRKEIEFDFGSGLRVTGFAALRKKASTSMAGFALFRRKRLIEGSGDESYRPSHIFGASTTAVYQRLFGELQLEGFDVSHTKDGFKWDENEEPFLELLREHLNADPLPLIDQAREAKYDLLRDTDADLNAAVAEAVKDTGEVLKASAVPILEEQISAKPDTQGPPPTLPLAEKSWKEIFPIELNGVNWQVTVEVTNDPSVADWIRVFDTGTVKGVRQVGVSLSLSNPFMVKFVGSDFDRIKPFVRLAAAIGLAEITARESGAKLAGEMRRNINQLLKDALAEY
jgi:hypothetical protein